MYTPQRLFGEVGSASDILSYEPFLERARLQREQERDDSARLALGAYVVARLIQKLHTMEDDSGAVEGFRWQLDAVRRHIDDLPSDAAETAHLAGIVGAIPNHHRPSPSLWKNLTAYAYFLEHEGRLEESLDMLSLAAQSQGAGAPAQDFTAYALFAARLNRLLARWEAANACYGAAEEVSSQSGDALSMLRGRLGRGAVHRGQGNYPAAQAVAQRVLQEATELRIVEAQAMAYADLGAVYASQGLRLQALEAEYQAFRLSTDIPQQIHALGNLATGLSEIGAFEAARLAFQIVAESNASVEVRANALLELMDLESSVGNRVAFERHRVAADEYRARMSPRMSVEYHYKLASGLARFSQTARARSYFKSALELAERHRLNGWYFKVEQAMVALEANGNEPSKPREPSTLSQAQAVRDMEVGLREYATTGAT